MPGQGGECGLQERAADRMSLPNQSNRSQEGTGPPSLEEGRACLNRREEVPSGHNTVIPTRRTSGWRLDCCVAARYCAPWVPESASGVRGAEPLSKEFLCVRRALTHAADTARGWTGLPDSRRLGTRYRVRTGTVQSLHDAVGTYSEAPCSTVAPPAVIRTVVFSWLPVATGLVFYYVPVETPKADIPGVVYRRRIFGGARYSALTSMALCKSLVHRLTVRVTTPYASATSVCLLAASSSTNSWT
jgi:hypothetical protein